MAFGAVKILDLNGLSYLYTKLKNNIDEFQTESKTVIDAAAAAANAAADRANSIADNANYAGSSSPGGAATSAEKLATARTITIAGAVSGSASFDGSGDVTITTSVQSGTSAPSSLDTGALYAVYEN